MKYRVLSFRFLPWDIQLGPAPLVWSEGCGIHCGRGSHQIGGSRLLGNDRYELKEDPGIHCGKGCCHGRRPLGSNRRREQGDRRRWWQ